MKDLPAFLKSAKYKKIKFKFLKTQHLLIKVESKWNSLEILF